MMRRRELLLLLGGAMTAAARPARAAEGDAGDRLSQHRQCLARPDSTDMWPRSARD